jgi:hypothetical protein
LIPWADDLGGAQCSALEPDPTRPFYLIVTDNDRGVFSVEGPMTDDRPWNAAARYARDQQQRRITCRPTGLDRDALAAEYRRAHPVIN